MAMREFQHYTRLPEAKVAENSVVAIGYCVRTQPAVAETGLRTLMSLLKSSRGFLVAQAVIVLKSVILEGVSSTSPQLLVARLAKQLDNISNSNARASVFWLVGQFAQDDGPDTTMGLKWEGVAPWVPDVLRKGVKGFVNEGQPAKLQILTLASKLLVLSPSSAKLSALTQYLFTLARYDQDYDIRDRARFLHALLRGVREEKQMEDGDEDVGGVTLRREQAKIVLLGAREVVRGSAPMTKNDFEVGTMSNIVHRKLGDYHPLPEWTDDPTDSSLRESDVRTAIDETDPSSIADNRPRPRHCLPLLQPYRRTFPGCQISPRHWDHHPQDQLHIPHGQSSGIWTISSTRTRARKRRTATGTVYMLSPLRHGGISYQNMTKLSPKRRTVRRSIATTVMTTMR